MSQVKKTSNMIAWRMLSLLLLIGAWQVAMAQNTLHVDPFVGKVGKTISVPVSITNADEIVAAQFDITLPFAPSKNAATLTSRANGHSLSTRINGNTVSVVLMSMENKPLRGSSGIVLRLPMTSYDDGHTATPYPVTISNIVLADRTGKNIATETSATSSFTASREKLPDLTVGEVNILTPTMTPGADAEFDYTIVNAGDAPTEAGWTTRLYLESLSSGVRTYIASQSYGQTMAAGESVRQSASVSLPLALHVDGSVRAVVEVAPQAGCGELIVDQDNNSGCSDYAFVTKRLFLSSNRTTVYEGYQNYATLTLLRTGDWSVNETYDVSASVSGLFSLGYNANVLPARVTIPAGASATTFRIYAVNDDIVRAREAEVCVAGAYGYDGVSCRLGRTDDDTNPLSLAASVGELTEGGELTLTATRGGELTDELELAVQCSQPERFGPIPPLYFEAGQSVATVKVMASDNEAEQLDVNVRFTVSATDYQTARTTVLLNDDDRPTIKLALSPSIVSETAGNNATTLTVKREGKKDHAVRVKVVADADEVFAGTSVVEIPAGRSSVEVPIGVNDNERVDATRRHTLSAMLYLPANGQFVGAGDRAYSTAVLTVTDDESPYLSLSARTSVVNEGASSTMTVSRTMASYSGSMTVALNSNDASCRVPASVTIPAGYTAVSFTVSVDRNTMEDDDRTVTITAMADDIESATMNLTVTDRTLPDAALLSVGHEDDLYAGVEASFVAEVHNNGTATLPKETMVDFVLSNYDYNYSRASLVNVGALPIGRDLAVGETMTVTLKARVPEMTGRYWLYAQVNKDGAVKEFSTAGNIVPHFQSVFIAAPFSVAEVTTDREDYLPGDDVIVTGRMVGRLNGQRVSIRLEGHGQNTAATTQIDAEGRFMAHVKVDRSAWGVMTVHATAVGQTEAEMTATANVVSMGLSADVTRLTCDVDYEKKGSLRIYNHSSKPITGVTLKHGVLPYGCALLLGDVPPTIAAGGYADVEYTVTPTVAMTGSQYLPFTLTAECEEGAQAAVDFAYFCRATDSNLSFSVSPLNTTLLLGGTRTVELTITNYGLKESGAVALSIPSDVKWLSSLAPASLPSIAPGESTTVRLLLTHNAAMHSGRTYSSFMRLAPENGATRGLNINVTVVGTEFSTLDVQASDVYSLADGDFSKLAGAAVVVTDKRTGQTVASGTLDEEGRWTTDQITEGTYTLTVSQNRHTTVTRTLSVGPGENVSTSVLLPYKAVITNFVTKQDIEDNSYSMESDIDIDAEAPQAIVVPTLSAHGFDCGTIEADIVFRNVGSRTALNPQFTFPAHIEGATFELLNAWPSYLKPGESFVLKVRYTGPETGIRRVIATLPMTYSFSIDGRTLSETDRYQQLVGCDVVYKDNDGDNDGDDDNDDVLPTKLPPYLDPYVPPTVNYDEGENTNLGQENGDRGHGASTSLPSDNSWYELIFDEVENIRPGQTVNATLHVHNGSMRPMTNVRFIPTAYDYESDDELSELVNVTEDEATDMTLDEVGYYSLEAMADGYLPLQFTAVDDILVDGERKVLMGGNLAYYNGGIGYTTQLPAMLVTVRPVGRMRVTYLVQHNLFGDDLTTEDKTESTEPAEMVMLVENTGKTTVENVTLEGSLLKVLSNDDLQPAPFSGLYAAYDGEQANLDMAATQIGSLDPQALSTMVWMFGSDEMAHVGNLADYAARQYTLAGGDVEIEVGSPHELVRAVYTSPSPAGADMATLLEEYCPTDVDFKTTLLSKADAFLLNDVEDENNEPDHVLIAADGNLLTVENVGETAKITGNSGTYILTLKAKQPGWVYATLHDPTNGHMMLTGVKRMSDGADISLANFWQTDRNIAPDYSVMSSHDLHFADCIAAEEEAYELTFTLLPDERLDVMAVRLYTAEGEEVNAGETTTEPIAKATVEFTKPIKKLFNQAVVFVANGQVVNLGDTPITPVDDSCYDINLAAADMIYPGLHQLTILLSGVKEKNAPRAPGVGEVTVSWTENNGAKVHVDLSVAPAAKYGTLSVETGDYDFGEFSVEAKAAPGYVFSYWTINGKRFTAGPELTYDLTQDAAIRAHFAPQSFRVEVAECEHGEIIGAVSGVYEGGGDVQFQALPREGYVFDGWMVNGEPMADKSDLLRMILAADLKVEAIFVDPHDYNRDGHISVGDITVAISEGVDAETITAIRRKVLLISSER